MKPSINLGLLLFCYFAVSYVTGHGGIGNIVPAAAPNGHAPIPAPVEHMPPPSLLNNPAVKMPKATIGTQKSLPKKEDEKSGLSWSGLVHILLLTSVRLQPALLAIGNYLGGGANSSGVVMANHQNGIHTATNFVEYPPVYGRNIHPEYKYLIEMPAKDLQKDMAFFGEIPNKNGGNKTDKPKQFKQLTKIDLSSCNNGKVSKVKHVNGEKVCETTVKLTKEQVLPIQQLPDWNATMPRGSPLWRETHIRYLDERRPQDVHKRHRKILQSSAVTITITNQCDFPTWPGVQCTDSRYNLPANGGLNKLGKGESVPLVVAGDISALRIWPRMGCDDNGEHCSSGQCGGDGIHCEGTGGQPPMTIGEFTLGTENGDFFDVSLVDGLNVPMTIIPSGGSGDKCRQIRSCDLRTLTDLPEEMVVKNSDGVIYLVKSPCGATGDPALCCAGNFGTPAACHPVYKDYSVYKEEKALCPDQYLYAYDDETSTFVCNGHTDYEIKLCPN